MSSPPKSSLQYGVKTKQSAVPLEDQEVTLPSYDDGLSPLPVLPTTPFISGSQPHSMTRKSSLLTIFHTFHLEYATFSSLLLYLLLLFMFMSLSLLDKTKSTSYTITYVRIFMILHLSTSLIPLLAGTATFFSTGDILRPPLVWRIISLRPTASSTHPLYNTHNLHITTLFHPSLLCS